MSGRARKVPLLLGLLLLLGAQGRGRPAADFTLPDAAGQPVRLSSFRGKVVVIDFWASWCEPCQRELPELDRIQRDFGGKVVVLPVSIDKERAEALAAAKRLKLGLRVVLDPVGKVAELYDPPKMPTSYVVDRDGVVRYIHEGYEGAKDTAQLRRELQELTR